MPKVGFVSLGCPKALVDSENILTQLRTEGYAISPDYQGADVVVVNTCGFIDSAVEESLDAIGEALAENGKVIVTGCLGAREEVVRSAHPKVLAITGPHAAVEVMALIHTHVPPPDVETHPVPPGGIKLTPRHYSYLKISEGCNHRCTFCIIPSLRGDLVSRPLNEVMKEAEQLVQAGTQELLVVSQDTGAYGVDLKYRTGFWKGQPLKTRLPELARSLGRLGAWVRLHYVYPYPSVDELLPLMTEGLILPYLDVPFQHAAPDILKAMKRPGDVEKVLMRVKKWRSLCPDLTLRSTFIVGFPGETEAHFEALLNFLSEAQLDRVGAFAYSPVEGAAANALANPVPESLKEERLARLMAHQAAISAARLKKRVGSTVDILIDEVDEDGLIGRSAAEAPEVDGVIYLPPHPSLQPGMKIQARLTDSDEHDLWADYLTP